MSRGASLDKSRGLACANPSAAPPRFEPPRSPLMTTQTALHKPPSRIAQYWALTKPRVTQLAVFCAVIGMFLATDGFPGWQVLVAGTAGIWLLAGAAFAVNCLVEAEIDARMARTARRATAMGELTSTQTIVFSTIITFIFCGSYYNFSRFQSFQFSFTYTCFLKL